MTPEIAHDLAPVRSADHATLFGLSRRYVAPARFRVSLHPLAPIDDPHGEPAGCLAHPESGLDPSHPEAIERELTILTWTMMALDVLHPEAFLAVPATADVVLAPAFPRTARQLECGRLMFVFQGARMGRGRSVLDDAVEAARRYGIRVAVAGNRVQSAAGFDAMFVAPETTAVHPPVSEAGAVIATDLATSDDLAWAERIGAHLVGGPAIAEPMRVAPVDVRRLDRSR